VRLSARPAGGQLGRACAMAEEGVDLVESHGPRQVRYSAASVGRQAVDSVAAPVASAINSSTDH
jgi:hypothetical protein